MAPIVLPLSLSSSSSSASASKSKQRARFSDTGSFNVQQISESSQLPEPAFNTALDPTIILRPDSHTLARDFAYPPFHPLHLGSVISTSPLTSAPRNAAHGEDEVEQYSAPGGSRRLPPDGPPWAEDPYLSSPVISTAAGGEREYFFSTSVEDEIHGRAVALFDFEPENDNEVALKEGQEIWISYRHGQGWLVAQDPVTGESGLVPEEYVEIIQRDAFQFQEGTVTDTVHSSMAGQCSLEQRNTLPVSHDTTVSTRQVEDDDDGWEDVNE
ncbi:hypothetical protein V1525DRAFT_454749 [Lipomyces kononenkoae]|uniref:Uncharacterized protein n=1 Tax=Lipomyces kononenkoae TaxID=34357 RepID=A0ACC3T836_LIPKO